ncbi:MAG: methyltransferase domain-containing protein [bacterium]
MPTKQVSGGNTLLNQRQLLEKVGLVQGMAVADLGCGTSGYFVLISAEMVGNSGRVYALDVQKSVLAGVVSAAKMSRFHNIETVWSNLEIYGGAKAIKDGSLDVALLINTLFQSTKKAEIIKEMARMLKPGGLALVIDWKMTDAPMGPAVASRVKKEEVIGWASQNGLKLKEEFEAGQYHFGLIFIKS